MGKQYFTSGPPLSPDELQKLLDIMVQVDDVVIGREGNAKNTSIHILCVYILDDCDQVVQHINVDIMYLRRSYLL